MSSGLPQATDVQPLTSTPSLRQPRLTPRTRAELHQLWSDKKMVPTIASRRAWCKIRGIPVDRVSGWFIQRKCNDKKAGKPVSDETYDLSLDIPDYILAERNDSIFTRRVDTPAPDSDDTLVTSSPPALHGDPQARNKRAYSHGPNDPDDFIPPLSPEPATEFVYPPDDLLLPFTPDENQPLCTSGIQSESESETFYTCPLCSVDISEYSEIPGSTSLDGQAYMLSCVDPKTKEITSDYKALSTLPASDFASIAFEYHLPDVYSPDLESGSRARKDAGLGDDKEQMRLFLPGNDVDEVDLGWMDKWKDDSVFMLVDNEEVDRS